MKKSSIALSFLILLFVHVGCKKESSSPSKTAPTGMATSAATDITSDGATLHGLVGATGGDNLTAIGFAWSETVVSPTVDDNVIAAIDDDGTALGSFSASINGLKKSTQYYFRSYAANTTGISYGTAQTFTTTGGGAVTIASLVTGEWKLTTYKENNVEKVIPDCDKDDIWHFKAGGDFTLHMAPVKCGSEPDSEDNHWSLPSDDKLNIFGLNHVNLVVNSTTMSFDFTGNDGIKITRIYTRQ